MESSTPSFILRLLLKPWELKAIWVKEGQASSFGSHQDQIVVYSFRNTSNVIVMDALCLTINTRISQRADELNLVPVYHDHTYWKHPETGASWPCWSQVSAEIEQLVMEGGEISDWEGQYYGQKVPKLVDSVVNAGTFTALESLPEYRLRPGTTGLEDFQKSLRMPPMLCYYGLKFWATDT